MVADYGNYLHSLINLYKAFWVKIIFHNEPVFEIVASI